MSAWRIAGVWINRYVTSIDTAARAAAWGAWKRANRLAYFKVAADRSRILYGDGVHLRTVGQAPIWPEDSEFRADGERVDRKTGQIVRPVNDEHTDPKTGDAVPSRITAPDLGFVKPFRGGKKGGHGVLMFGVLDDDAVPIADDVRALVPDERPSLSACLDELDRDYFADLPAENRVLVADSGLNGQPTRRRVIESGPLPCIHDVAGGEREESVRHREAKATQRYDIDDYPDWQLDGFREPHCRHG